jgi:hypothetical protein
MPKNIDSNKKNTTPLLIKSWVYFSKRIISVYKHKEK